MWNRISNVGNQTFRDQWISEVIKSLPKISQDSGIFDVGAGQQPYRSAIESEGFSYFSHDFNEYTPNKEIIGFQNQEWKHLEHNYVCDILELPPELKFDYVICTEVLEHVSDPAKTIQKLTNLVNPGGQLIITVPLNSHIHQAPHYYSAGLSPWWFEKHLIDKRIKKVEILIHGDYADVLAQDLATYLNFKKPFRIIGLPRIARTVIKSLRFLIPKETLESSGYGVMVRILF